MRAVRTVLLFYKRLIEPGGAERLLLHEYEELTKLGYRVFIVTYELKAAALFSYPRDRLNILELSGNAMQSWWQLLKLCYAHRQDSWLCASGHIDIYLASILAGSRYALHVHHPAFMSFNDYDKYSIFLQAHFDDLLRSNFGATRFQHIRARLTLPQKIRLNLRALLSILSLRRANEIFVLSRYAQQEKKRLYKVESKVLCGALDDQQVNNMLPQTVLPQTVLPQTLLPQTLLPQTLLPQTLLPQTRLRNSTAITIFTVARLDVNKRLDELIKAFCIFCQTEPNARLLIGGRGPEKATLAALVLSLNLQNKVEFLGFVDDAALRQHYAAADLFVSIDWADYKITMFESLAMQTKVLVSEETEIDAALLDSGYVWVSPPVAEWVAKKMLVAINTHPQWSPKQLQTHLLEYTWPKYVQKIAAALEAVA